ncbi:hypothetical protein CMI37_01430 [Candidatus Pacearchaeota archaeon]|nr:hypothetical protein [Candidatus Pacearchaeota archaeon]|tara:strand:- start:3376 stop:3999 length:624 start_codon:yes stop_codon:yes gene_type:complete
MPSDTNNTPPAGGITIEYMDETTNQRHVEKHTTARTVAEFIEQENLPAGTSISVGEAIAHPETPLEDGSEVTVTSGNKTGGITTMRRKTVNSKSYDATYLTNNGQVMTLGREVDTVATRHRGKKLIYQIFEGMTMPEKNQVSSRGTKYPFHSLRVNQNFVVPFEDSVLVRAAMRHFMTTHTDIILQARSIFLDDDVKRPVLSVWRTR